MKRGRENPATPSALLAPRITSAILLLRGQKVMLDADLARLYGVETKNLIRAVKRNLARFPEDFMFELNDVEVGVDDGTVHTHSREQGVAMLSSVLRSARAVLVNVEIMRAFVRLREMLSSNAELARKLATLERKYDSQCRAVFDAIRELMVPPDTPKRSIGFGPWRDR